MKKLLIVWTTGLLMLSACIPGQPLTSTGPGVETIVAQTLEAVTAAAPTPIMPANGLPVSYNNISFTIPLELNASATPSTNRYVEFPYINPSNGPMPEHVVFKFTSYPVEGDAKIMVFKASDYAAYGQPLQEVVTALLGGQDSVKPMSEALIQGEFYAQRQPLNFKNGHGVRYLTQVLTNAAPITNKDLFYYYQGITTDGAYFVSAVFHVNAAFLVANSNPDSPTPPEGVPFGDPNNVDFPAYLSTVTQKLNDTPPVNYTPSLTLLDKLIESLEVTTP